VIFHGFAGKALESIGFGLWWRNWKEHFDRGEEGLAVGSRATRRRERILMEQKSGDVLSPGELSIAQWEKVLGNVLAGAQAQLDTHDTCAGCSCSVTTGLVSVPAVLC
jgi:hypothetical protein